MQPTAQGWIAFTDGAWGQAGAGASAVLTAPSGVRLKYAARLEFKSTNNIAEYEGLVLGLNKVKALGVKTILAKTDSQVIARQVKKNIWHENQSWSNTWPQYGHLSGNSRDSP